MKSPRFTIVKAFALAVVLAASARAGVRIAVFTPEDSMLAASYADAVADALRPSNRVVDAGLARTAFASAGFATPYNLESSDARNAAAAIGCDFFILVRAADQRRNSFEKKEYIESYAAVYVVDGRSGQLTLWKITSFSGFTAEASERLLLESAPTMAKQIAPQLTAEAPPTRNPSVPDAPEEGTPSAKGFRPPLPYRRLSPAYTTLASLYGVTATVDVEVEFDAAGAIAAANVVRWAGYGLDESVLEAVRRMTWRPGSFDGIAKPVRVLLRYNFRKLEKQSAEVETLFIPFSSCAKLAFT